MNPNHQPRDYPAWHEQETPPPTEVPWLAVIGIIFGLSLMAWALW